MRELTGSRDCLAALDQRFPGTFALKKKEIAAFLGISYNTLRKYYPELWKTPMITKADLARLLAKKSA